MISFTAGAILGILYAPAEGSKTRTKLSGIGNDLKDGWNAVTEGINDKIEYLRDGIDNIAENSMDKVEDTQFSVIDKGGFL